MMMLAYMYKRQSHILISKILYFKNLSSATPISRSYTTKQIIPTNLDNPDFMISFLENKCGLSGKALISACKCLNFDSSDQRPDSVLELLRTFGFPLSSITKIISAYPFILQKFHHEQVIKPKLDFLLSISQSQEDVVAIITKIPFILTRSLTSHLIPSFNLLNSVTGSYPNTLSVLKHNPSILTQNIPKSFLLNTQFLLKLGVPYSQIPRLLKSYGQVLGKPHDKFRNFVSKLMDIGFDLEASYFLKALHTLTFVNDSTWKSRCALFKSFGFSDQEILSMFKKYPYIMSYNEKTIIEKTEFFLNKLQWTPFRLSSNPAVLSYSLEKRIIPRCSVLQVLVSENSISESYLISTILAMTEKIFIENFVTAHKDVPGVMEAYQGKLKFDEYTFKQKGHKDDIHSASLILVTRPTPISRSYTTKQIIPTNLDNPDFKISFLENKCGLSGKALISACKCLNFDSSDQRPDSVLDLFRSFGFPMSSVTKIISSYPRILQSCPEKVLQPKLECHAENIVKAKLDFLLSISQSQAEVVAIVTKNPIILSRSLSNYLKPFFNLLNSVTGSYPNTLSVLKYNPYILTQNIPKSFWFNTQFLIELGVTHSQILKLLRRCGNVLGKPHDKFRNFVLKLQDMGFDLESSYFLKAIHTLCYVTDLTWESNCVLFKSFGFSDHEFLCMFKKLPCIMCYSDKSINEKMEFFLYKLQWEPLRLSSYPAVLIYSLEKRTIPRCSVLEVLVLKKSTSESYTLSTILRMTERRFVKDFVTAHKDKIPEVMEAYEGKLRFDEYTFKHKEQLRSKAF